MTLAAGFGHCSSGCEPEPQGGSLCSAVVPVSGMHTGKLFREARYSELSLGICAPGAFKRQPEVAKQLLTLLMISLISGMNNISGCESLLQVICRL